MDTVSYASTTATSDSLHFMITDLASCAVTGAYKIKAHPVIYRKYFLLHR